MMLRSALLQACHLLARSSGTGSVNQLQKRGTVIMRRAYEPGLRKDGEERALKKREYIYIMEEMRATKPAGDMRVLLIRDVEGVGMKGDVVTVTKRIARMRLMPAGDAVYPTDENIAKIQEELKDLPKKERQSLWAEATIRQLANMHLPIPMNPETEWVLNKTHVKAAFRKVGVQLSEDCITLPEEEVTGPQSLEFTVTVNKLTDVPIKATVYHWYAEDRNYPEGKPPKMPPTWGKTSPKHKQRHTNEC